MLEAFTCFEVFLTFSTCYYSISFTIIWGYVAQRLNKKPPPPPSSLSKNRLRLRECCSLRVDLGSAGFPPVLPACGAQAAAFIHLV